MWHRRTSKLYLECAGVPEVGQMDRNLFSVFGERDPALRSAASELTYTDDVEFVDLRSDAGLSAHRK